MGRESALDDLRAHEDGTVRVRAARVGDAPDVARLLGVLGYPCSASDAADRITLILGEPRQHLLLAEVDGHVCGLVSVYALYSLAHGCELARITSMVVAEDAQRHGVGRRLLREAESLARRTGIARIEITSNARREGAHAFYRGCGYSDDSLRFVKLLGD